jgi:ABC-2 type transport system permease protein
MQAMQMSFFVFLPSIMLSGFMFPRESMPLFFNWIGNLIPLTFYLQILRGIILKGVGISVLWSQVICLIVFITVLFALSVIKLQKKVG